MASSTAIKCVYVFWVFATALNAALDSVCMYVQERR